MKLNDKVIGEKTYIIAEIGINHNGDMHIVRELIRESAHAGADAVKFQKRTPEICTPESMWSKMRYDTPWGDVKYIDYRRFVELDADDYNEIKELCDQYGIDWFASPWDIPSVDFLECYDPICYKVASAMLTNIPLLEAIKLTGRPVIMSKGGSTVKDLKVALNVIGHEDVAIMHCVAKYPVADKNLHLMDIPFLKKEFPNIPVGYSGHEVGIATTVAAVVLGADLVERHITLDRAMWGSDQSASMEVQGFRKLIRDIRAVHEAMSAGGDGKPQQIEVESIKKLRYWDE